MSAEERRGGRAHRSQVLLKQPMEPMAIASAVLQQASQARPADLVLREALRNARGLSAPASAAVARAVFAAFRWQGWMEDPLDVRAAVAWQDRFDREPGSFPDDELVARAVPDWVRQELAVSPAWVRALQAEPTLWLRARPGQAADLGRRLDDCRTSDRVPDAVEYLGRLDLFRTPEFQAGEFELQDISSQAVGRVCGGQGGQTWWDACAGEGGKTLHLSDLMGNKGLIWASDRAAWRLNRLKFRAGRARVFNYRAAAWDGGRSLPTKTKFDGVLVDAPCSGLGTWQRNPHARWTVSPQDVRELAQLQHQLLAHAAPAVRPGGKLIYAACTLTRAETEDVAAHFAERHPEFEPETVANPFEPSSAVAGSLLWWPQETRGNGMFVAAWRRKSG